MKIKNFGQVNHRIFRGSQPKCSEYQLLYDMGIRTIIDLRDDREDYAIEAAESAGLRYINLPLSSRTRPSAEFPEMFLKIVMDEGNGPAMVHCQGGRHRTGIACAIFRLRVDGWDLEETMAELHSYDFGWWNWRWLGHTRLREFIENYAAQIGRGVR